MELDQRTATTPATGTDWDHVSLAAGERVGSGPWVEQRSPIENRLVQRFRLAQTFDVNKALDRVEPPVGPWDQERAELERQLQARRAHLLESLRLETGYSSQDAEEVLASTFDYLNRCGPPQDLRQCEGAYAWCGRERRFRTVFAPWGTVVAVLPRNASLILGVTCLLNALDTGNGVVLRFPQQCARTAGLFADACDAAGLSAHVAILVSAGRQTIDAVISHPRPSLLHFFGSSSPIGSLAGRCFDAGKGFIGDGEGNGWAYVDQSADPEVAASAIASASLRYSGQTCTALNGAYLHPSVAEAVRHELARRFQTAEIGPLFEEEQARWCVSRIDSSGGVILAGGRRDGCWLTPTLVNQPSPSSELVKEGVFGPVLWLTEGDGDAFGAAWRTNRFPLVAAVFGDADEFQWARRLPNLARLTVNGDPSFEDPFAPWGGYAASGINPVGGWSDKYQRAVQIDGLV